MADQEDQNLEPVEIRALSLNLTPEVDADDMLVAVRVVPDGRDRNIVLARSLRLGEGDDGTPVVVNPALGERLQLRPGSVQISIRDVDRYAKQGPDGYAPITNTIWTYLSIGDPVGPELFRYLLAAARRLDGTHALLAEISSIVTDLSGGFIGRREQFYRAISIAEILTVALGRSVDLLDGIRQHFSVGPSLPAILDSKKDSIRQIRNAFEHIEDRALGQVHGRPHPDALTVFEQHDFVAQGKLTYGSHSLDLRVEVPQMLVEARQYIYDVAVDVAGPTREMARLVEFFGPEEA